MGNLGVIDNITEVTGFTSSGYETTKTRTAFNMAHL